MIKKKRLIVNNCINNLKEFKSFAKEASIISKEYDLRIAVSGLSEIKNFDLKDNSDPYLQYSINFAGLQDFIVHKKMKSFQNLAFVKKNRELLAKKMAILKELNLKAAFIGREPVYQEEALFEKYPDWRGPRIDHPRRSKRALFAMCLHNKEVQELYKENIKNLVKEFPGLDSFYFWTNDSGGGFCWHEGSYFGANGPHSCKDIPNNVAIENFQNAILDGAKEGGAKSPISLLKNTKEVWNANYKKAGAYEAEFHKKEKKLVTIGSEFAFTYPVKNIVDPIGRFNQYLALKNEKTEIGVLWLSDIYQRSYTDIKNSKLIFELIKEITNSKKSLEFLDEKVSLFKSQIQKLNTKEASNLITEAYINISKYTDLFNSNLYNVNFVVNSPTYSSVSHRWLTRPLVAFQERLENNEKDYYLKHIFNVFGEEGKSNLLDIHGKMFVNPAGDYNQCSSFINKMNAYLKTASDLFYKAIKLSEKSEIKFLENNSMACRMAIIFLNNIRNTLEFAVLRKNGYQELEEIRNNSFLKGGGDLGWLDDYKKIVFRVLRSELDNTNNLIALLDKTTSKNVLELGATIKDEDCFCLSPKLKPQLIKKKKTMLKYWNDVMELFPKEEATSDKIYWYPE